MVKTSRTIATLGASAALALGAFAGLAPAAQAASGSTAQTAVSKAGDRGVTTAKAAGNTSGVAALKGGSKADLAIKANCYNGYVSGASFYMTCTGNGYRVYVDCSNAVRYIFSTYYYGTWNHILTCPSGTYAIWGGSIGG